MQFCVVFYSLKGEISVFRRETILVLFSSPQNICYLCLLEAFSTLNIANIAQDKFFYPKNTLSCAMST